MIKEISQFIEHLEENSPDIFLENLKLKEGCYTFLEEENGQLVIKDENILLVKKDTDINVPMYQDFLERYLVSEMIKDKSLNTSEKIYIEIGTPFGISFSKKGYFSGMEEKNGVLKRVSGMQAYFKTIQKYWSPDNKEHLLWFNQTKKYLEDNLFDDIQNIGSVSNLLEKQSKDVKDNFMFFFYLKSPKTSDYKIFHDKYLAHKVFLNDLKKNETLGISNDLTVGNVTKKPFLLHKTAPFAVNNKIESNTAKHLYKFFRLQQKNKVLPNPMPIFVDTKELNLSQKAIKIFIDDRKKGHREIIETLLNLNDSNRNLQNYYLIYFQGNLKGSQIIDIDFVPVFRYNTKDMPSVKPIFNIKNDKFFEFQINNIFEFQEKIMNVAFNKQLVQKGRIKYFDDLEVKPQYGATSTIVNLLYQYRKSIYDFIYKSRQQAITSKMFHEIMWNSIFDDVKHDQKTEKTTRIKEKLNIWFSFYQYFNNQKQEDMASKIPELLARCKLIANSDNEYLSDDPKEFAFAMGQVIYFLFTKSVAANKKHSLLEPFLQKTTAEQLQMAVSNLIGTYKHELDFGQGRFERLSKEVLAYETDVNMKKIQRYILAGYFAQPVIFEKTNKIEESQN